MDSGFYAACAGLVAKMKALDSSAHNLANVSTTAFKGQRLDFQSLLAQANRGGLSPLNQALNSYGVAATPTVDFSEGSLQRTGNPLDVAIEGTGFLTVQTKTGKAYTRNGQSQLSAVGQLVTASGDPILGLEGPINVPPGSVSISAEGVISVDGAITGNLQVVDFDPSANLQETAPGLYVSDSVPKATTKSAIRQGALESANVNPVEAAVGLVTIQREAEMLQRALSLFHGEMNRVATADLARV